jgi:carboxylesterase
VGCLLLHGFTATPQELRGLGETLHAHGYTVSGVRIAGHATSVDDLAHTSRRDWADSARAGLTELRRHCSTTVVIGLSMGSLLALELAHDHAAEVDGVVLLSTALWTSDRRLERMLPLLPLMRLAGALLPARWQRIAKPGRDIADPVARSASPAYDTMPLRALVSLIDLQRAARAMVPAVRQPVLVLHARQDHTCPLDNVRFLQQRLPTPPRVELLDNSFHVVSVDYDKDRVATAVAEFVASIATAAGARLAAEV